MEVFGLLWLSVWTMWMIFWIIAFSTVMQLKKQVEELEQKILEWKK